MYLYIIATYHAEYNFSACMAYDVALRRDFVVYLYIIATYHAEYNFSACMAYDVAFRRKAARFRLSSWGQIDPQLYTKAFTGSGKANPRAWYDHCLTSSHSSSDCPLFFLW